MDGSSVESSTEYVGLKGIVIQKYSYPPGFVLVLVIVLGLETLAGVVSNITVLLVHLLNKRSIKKNSSKAFLINLSIVDLSISVVTIPMTIARVAMNLSVTTTFCVFHEATISMATTSSGLALMLISLDRYRTIVWPFRSQESRQSTPYLLGAMWLLVAVGFTLPIAVLMPRPRTAANCSGSSGSSNGSNSVSCFLWIREDGARIYHEIYYVVVYVVANLVILVCYAHILRMAKRRIISRISLIKATVVGLPGIPGMNVVAQKMHERRVTRMTLMIVLTFFVCWAPHATVSATILVLDVHYMEFIHLVCLALAYSTTLLHPMLYAFMREDFRRLFPLSSKPNERTTDEAPPKQRKIQCFLLKSSSVNASRPETITTPS